MSLIVDTKVFRLGKDLAILGEIAMEHEILESQHEASGRSSMSTDAPVCTHVNVKAPFKENPAFLVWTIQTTGWARNDSPDKILKDVSALSLHDAFVLWMNQEIKRLPHTKEVDEVF
ncbi:MAG: hypothetical protein U0X20_11790 [Caldilineaceae bacterium]